MEYMTDKILPCKRGAKPNVHSSYKHVWHFISCQAGHDFKTTYPHDHMYQSINEWNKANG